MRRRKVGSVNHLFQLPVLGVAVAVVGLLAYRQVARIARPSQLVVVARSALAAGTMVEDDDVKAVRRGAGDVPEGAISEEDDVTGKRLTRSKDRGEAFVLADFQAARDNGDHALASQIPEGRLLTTLTIRNVTLPRSGLRRGDRIDILVAGLTPQRYRAARVVVRDAYVVGYLSSTRPVSVEQKRGILGMPSGEGDDGPPELSLILALEPDDVLPVAAIDGSGQHVTLVLHNPAADPQVNVASRPNPKPIDVITGAERKRLIVQ